MKPLNIRLELICPSAEIDISFMSLLSRTVISLARVHPFNSLGCLLVPDMPVTISVGNINVSKLSNDSSFLEGICLVTTFPSLHCGDKEK